jgi:predicted hydrolase (HD superfamily)
MNYIANPNMIKHCLATEAVMRSLPGDWRKRRQMGSGRPAA